VNRLLKEDFDDDDYPGAEVLYTYDAASQDYPLAGNLKGKLAYVTDLTGGAFFSYDPRGNVSWQIKRLNQHDGEKDDRTSLNYDGLNRVIAQVWPDGEGVKYEYDDRGLLKGIPGILNQLQYEVSGQLSVMDYANGITAEYAYDPRQRISELKSRDNADQSLQHLTYQLDGVGNITRIQDERAISGTAPQFASQDFQYDHLSRLTQASGVYGTIDFQYDSIGNMISKISPEGIGHVDDTLINLGTMTYGGLAGSSGRFGKGTQPGPHAISTTASGLQYDYDQNGNMTSHATGDQYEWDYKDRLTHVLKDGKNAWYTYDHSGQRVSKKVQTDTGYDYTYYITKEYEIREQQAFKYVFAGSKRIARIKTQIESGTLEQQTVQLKEGWNFISFALDPVDPDPNAVFDSIKDQLEEVFAHQLSTNDYTFYKPDELSNLFTISAYTGYIVNMKSAAELTITGMRPDRPLELKKGWNLVGFPTSGTVSTVLEQIQHDYDVVWTFDSSSDDWIQLIKGTNLPAGFNSLSTITPGKAYWVRTLRDTVFAPSTTFTGQAEFYHPDHLGSTNVVTNQTGQVLDETQYYP
ncbi:MAG: RHS repeat protein, partial [Proteobacteria bacterium]|nr:RHS repeat protein [Pseudomonadota bacterium]